MNVKYAILVDGEWVDYVTLLAPVKHAWQKDNIARDYANKNKIGWQGIKVVRCNG